MESHIKIKNDLVKILNILSKELQEDKNYKWNISFMTLTDNRKGNLAVDLRYKKSDITGEIFELERIYFNKNIRKITGKNSASTIRIEGILAKKTISDIKYFIKKGYTPINYSIVEPGRQSNEQSIVKQQDKDNPTYRYEKQPIEELLKMTA